MNTHNETTQEKQRTLQQNKSIHLFCEFVASALNEKNLDMKVILKPDIEIPASSYAVKEFLWKPIQKYQLGKSSTTMLSTKEVTEIYEIINRHLAQFEISVMFPSIEEQAIKELLQ